MYGCRQYRHAMYAKVRLFLHIIPIEWPFVDDLERFFVPLQSKTTVMGPCHAHVRVYAGHGAIPSEYNIHELWKNNSKYKSSSN